MVNMRMICGEGNMEMVCGYGEYGVVMWVMGIMGWHVGEGNMGMVIG